MIIPPPTLPTDLEIFKTIYELYYDDFMSSEKKPWVNTDRDKIARKMNADTTLVSGRIYYRLGENNYRVLPPEEVQRNTEIISLGGSNIEVRGCDMEINFTYMTSVLADLKDKEEKFWTSTVIAVGALIFSLFALLKDGVNF